MTLKEAIYTRKSCRDFEKRELNQDDLLRIQYYIDHEVHPLFPNIKTKIVMEDKTHVKSLFPWLTNQVISIYSEEKEGYGINAGFMLQHIELYLHTLGIGCCWIGMSKSNHKQDGLSYLICLSIGYPKKELKRDVSGFKRKDWNEFSDRIDSRLEGARLAPSSRNSQPWYFTHDKDVTRLWYIPQKGAFKSIKLKPNLMNEIDLGIITAHICICNDGVQLFKEKNVQYQNYMYALSFKINGNA